MLGENERRLGLFVFGFLSLGKLRLGFTDLRAKGIAGGLRERGPLGVKLILASVVFLKLAHHLFAGRDRAIVGDLPLLGADTGGEDAALVGALRKLHVARQHAVPIVENHHVEVILAGRFQLLDKLGVGGHHVAVDTGLLGVRQEGETAHELLCRVFLNANLAVLVLGHVHVEERLKLDVGCEVLGHHLVAILVEHVHRLNGNAALAFRRGVGV